MPPLYRPQLARLVKQAPEGDDWLHERKYDGCRIGCAIGDRTVTLLSRNGREWTAAFPEIVKARKSRPRGGAGVHAIAVDAWAGYWTAKQRLTPAAIAAIAGV